MVRLKGLNTISYRRYSVISIPYGAIKRQGIINVRKPVSSISIPYGAIKSHLQNIPIQTSF